MPMWTCSVPGHAQRAQRPGRRRRRRTRWASPARPWPGGWAPSTGAGRRFEHKGDYHGAEVYDDYAHHPGELHALLTTAQTLGYRADHLRLPAPHLHPHQGAV